jgi:tRNA 2-thiouridine synthesizing protein E
MVIVADLPVSFDQDGFLTDADRWDRELAREIAGGLGITGLTQAHWSILCYLRVHYLTQGELPWEAHVCRDLGLDRDCLRRLFGGPLSAWKVAGLPNPGEEARTYLTSHEVPHASSGPR